MTFSDRLAIEKEYETWLEETRKMHFLEDTPFNFMVFLHMRGLLKEDYEKSAEANSEADRGMHNKECYNDTCPQHKDDTDPIAFCDGIYPEYTNEDVEKASKEFKESVNKRLHELYDKSGSKSITKVRIGEPTEKTINDYDFYLKELNKKEVDYKQKALRYLNWLIYIKDIAYDRDGYHNAEDLGELIDDLRAIAVDAIKENPCPVMCVEDFFDE